MMLGDENPCRSVAALTNRTRTRNYSYLAKGSRARQDAWSLGSCTQKLRSTWVFNSSSDVSNKHTNQVKIPAFKIEWVRMFVQVSDKGR